LSVRIAVRDDDAQAIHRIKDNLQVGQVTKIRRHGAANPQIGWTCERVKDLTEVVIPLFDNYPLYTKKANEFSIWKPLVIDRYIATLGGYSNRRRISKDQWATLHNGIQAIKKIRTY
jgi:hypothetical protein